MQIHQTLTKFKSLQWFPEYYANRETGDRAQTVCCDWLLATAIPLTLFL